MILSHFMVFEISSSDSVPFHQQGVKSAALSLLLKWREITNTLLHMLVSSKFCLHGCQRFWL